MRQNRILDYRQHKLSHYQFRYIRRNVPRCVRQNPTQLPQSIWFLIIFIAVWLFSSTFFTFAQDPTVDGQPIWSPDGEQIAFISTRDGQADIWVMQKDGSNPINLTSNFTQPMILLYSWSPDGKFISFVPFPLEDEKLDVWLVSVNDFSVRNLTTNIPSSAGGNPTWSPNGEFIAYVADNEHSKPSIWITELATGEATHIDVEIDEISPKWLNNDVLFFTSYSENDVSIQSIDIQSGEMNILDMSDVIDYAVSPDGTKIVYATNRDDSIILDDIVIYSLVDNQEVTRIHDPRWGMVEGFDWSADSQKVALHSLYTRCAPEITLNIMMLDINKSEISELVDCEFGDSTNMDWSSDNETIVFESTRDDNVDIWTINIKTGELVNLTLSN